MKESIGHLDFVFIGGVLQPGCQTDRFLSPELLLESSNKTVTSHERQVVNQKSLTGYVLASSCSHTKAHKYYEESVTNTVCPFIYCANSLCTLQVRMGYYASSSTQGTFSVSTSSNC